MKKEWIAVMSQDTGGIPGVAGYFHQHKSGQFYCRIEEGFGVCTQPGCGKKEKLENFEKEYGKLKNG